MPDRATPPAPGEHTTIRRTKKPFLLETSTYRMRGHYEPDDQAYVNKDELAMWAAKDPIERAAARLVAGGTIEAADLETMRQRVDARVAGAVEFAFLHDIGAEAEIERVAERQQADIADQQVERAGKQRKAQRLHQEQRIDKERRDDQHRHHRAERDDLAAAFGRMRGRGERFGGGDHHVVLPNRPAGRTRSTIAITTKITVFDASG